ncbi:MAG: Peptidase, partial [Actinotalea sp.]|nr:Peptidase [Actinotalea sp.]
MNPLNPVSPVGRARLHRIRAALGGIVVAALLATGLAVPAIADEFDDQRSANEQRQAAVDAAAEQLAHELEDTDAALVQAFTELQATESQIPAAEQQLAEAEALVAQLQLEAQIIAERLVVAQAEETTITGQIQADTDRADDIRIAIGQMARDAYKGDMAATSLSAVLDAQSTEEFVEQSSLATTALRTQTQALRDLEQINGVNRNRQARLAAVREQITTLKAEADQKVVEAEAARQAAEARKVELEQLRAQQQVKAAEIQALKDVQLAKQAELDAQQAALETELAEIVRLQAVEREKQRVAA